ncbi:MAG: formate transporter FocA [Desulfobacterales bacterium]|nr:formate transporter FocA [Desulfobacterales bacterium]
MNSKEPIQIDALVPAEMAAKAEQVGIKKAQMDIVDTFVLSLLAGAFISLGAVFATTIATGSIGIIPYGVRQLLSGFVFSLGLVLVIVGGAELFTGNAMIIMAWAGKKVSTISLLKNWIVVFIGNLVGSIATVILVFISEQYTFGNGAVGNTALMTANAKSGLDFFQAIALGILCNALVCLAVWLTFSARSTTDRILAIIPPITAFVAAGFEHSIANMYFIPMGNLIKSYASPSFWVAIGKTPSDFMNITWNNFIFNNLVPVTIGNIIGGGFLVAAVYWFIYLRKHRI